MHGPGASAPQIPPLPRYVATSEKMDSLNLASSL